MKIAKAYQMLLAAHDSRRSGLPTAVGADRGRSEPWLSAGIYRAVSRTADLIDRIGIRGETHR